MKVHNGTGLRNLLEQMPAEELKRLLQAELEQEVPDPDSVRLMLSVLEEQGESPSEEQAPQKAEAWETYQKRVAGLRKKPHPGRSWALRAASVILILGLLFTILPQEAEAKTFWEMLQRMSDSVISFFSGQGRRVEADYVFETDNPGLQKVYDTAVEMGVDVPMVPMWLPGEPELEELQPYASPVYSGIYAKFTDTDRAITFKLEIYSGKPAHQYYKDDSLYESYEREGTTYNITKNNDRWVAVWTNDNIECSITLDCQEETLRRILKSIYVMEE